MTSINFGLNIFRYLISPVFLIPVVLNAFIILMPLCRAYQAGLAAARDPATRVTLFSPWFFFDRVFWAHLRRRYVVWIVYFLVYNAAWVGFLYYQMSSNLSFPFSKPLYFSYIGFMLFTNIPIYLLMMNAYASIFAPRCNQLWAMICLCLFFHHALERIFFHGIALVGLRAAILVFLPADPAQEYVERFLIAQLICHLITICMAILVAWAVRRRQRRGEAWFRFEQ